MTDKEPQGEGLELRRIIRLHNVAPNDFALRTDLIASKIEAAGYVKLPAPGTEAYQKLKKDFGNIVLALDSELKYANARGAATEKLFDLVLALLGEEK